LAQNHEQGTHSEGNITVARETSGGGEMRIIARNHRSPEFIRLFKHKGCAHLFAIEEEK
jgi:hypothetical protein